MKEVYLARKVTAHVPDSRWVVSLSNGETIFEDRTPHLEPAWARLADYVKQNKLAITKMRVQLGPLEVSLPSHAFGYVQKKKVAATSAWSKEYYCVGHVERNGMSLIHYIASDRSSTSEIEPDPGAPWTIYDCRG